MEINELQKTIYEQAVSRGLYKGSPGPNKLLHHIKEEAVEAIGAWKAYKDLQTHYDCKSRQMANCIKYDFQCPKCPYRSNEGVNQELADIIIMTLSACAYLGIDIETAIKTKMDYNAIRER